MERPRINIDIPEPIYKELKSLLGNYRLQNKMFQSIVIDLVIHLRALNEKERKLFFLDLTDREIRLGKWCNLFRKEQKNAADKS